MPGQPLEYPPPPAWASALVTAGVTGTNGKSTTATWLARALSARDPNTALVTTLGARVGTELMPIGPTFDRFLEVMRACRQRGGHTAVIELTSAALSSGFMRGWPCRVGVFTNLSVEHLDAHGSVEHYLASKAQLFVSLPRGGVAVLNGKDEVSALLEEVIPAGVRVLRYGAAGSDLYAEEVRFGWSGTTLVAAGRLAADLGGDRRVEVAGVGPVFADNALAALLGAYALGVPLPVGRAELAGAEAPPGRFERVACAPDVVVDYAHTPDAITATVRAGRALCLGRLSVVLGAGGGTERSKRGPMGAAAAAADRVILTSDNPRGEDPAAIVAALAEGVGPHGALEIHLDRVEAIERALSLAGPDDLVLVLGKGHERTNRSDRPGLRGPLTDAELVRRLRG